jgi:hypothetical protein
MRRAKEEGSLAAEGHVEHLYLRYSDVRAFMDQRLPFVAQESIRRSETSNRRAEYCANLRQNEKNNDDIY